MKKLIFILFILYTTCSFAFSQTQSDYLVVVENNEQTKDYSIVKIYDAKDQVVYEEHIEGIYIDIAQLEDRKLIQKVSEQFNFFMSEGIERNRYEGFIELVVRKKV